MSDDREEDEDNNMSASVSYSDDTEAAWLRKGNKSFHGFKIPRPRILATALSSAAM